MDVLEEDLAIRPSEALDATSHGHILTDGPQYSVAPFIPSRSVQAIVSAELMAMTITNSYLNVSQQLETHQLIVDGVVVTLSTGNYTGTALAAELQTQIVAQVPLPTMTVVFDATQSKFTFNDSVSVFTISAPDAGANVSNISHLLGFVPGVDYASGAPGVDVTSPLAADLNPVHNIYVRVQDLQDKGITLNSNRNCNFCVPMPDGGYGSRVTYQQLSGSAANDSLQDSSMTLGQAMAVEIVDAAGRHVPFQSPWELVMRLSYLRNASDAGTSVALKKRKRSLGSGI